MFSFLKSKKQKYVSLAYAQELTAAWATTWTAAERAEYIRQVELAKKAIKEYKEAANRIDA